MKKILILLLLTNPVFAGEMFLTWLRPTTYANEAPLPLEDIGGYLISMVCDSDKLLQHNIEGGDTTSVSFKGVPDGTCRVTIQAYTKTHLILVREHPETTIGIGDPAPPVVIPVGNNFGKPSIVAGLIGMEKPE